MSFKVGDRIEVMGIEPYPIRGRIMEVDSHPFEYGDALIDVETVCIDPVRMWVNLRLAKKVTP